MGGDPEIRCNGHAETLEGAEARRSPPCFDPSHLALQTGYLF